MSRLACCDPSYDLAIIGGGIYGAALYWEACHRGVKTLLVEQTDFGSGTSSNSLRTIHGGLRYLQSMDVARCMMSAQERQVLLGIAPNLIEPLPCIMPTQRKFSRSRFFLKAGTLSYDILTLPIRWRKRAGHQLPRTRLLSPENLEDSFPALKLGDVTGGALWYDAQVVDSERLTLNYILSGDKTGIGTSLNYTRADKLVSTEKYVSGLLVSDTLSGETASFSADQVVDCSSSWNFSGSASTNRQDFGYVKGFNLVFPGNFCEAAIGVEIPGEDNRTRLLFVSPWQSKTLVGTWYLPAIDGSDASITDDDIDLALAELRSIDSNNNFCKESLIDVHVGQLPVDAEQSSADDLADVLQAHSSIDCADGEDGAIGLFRLKGTKYTTAREGAKRMVDTLAKTAKIKISPSRSHARQLLGCSISDIHESSADLHREFSNLYGDEVVNFCLTTYGEFAQPLMKQAHLEANSSQPIDELLDLVVRRAFENEKAQTANDVLLRRLGSLPASILRDHSKQLEQSLSKYLSD